MKCYAEFITTPTADTPGTLLLLHFDDRRYLIGNVPEGTQRACNERGIGMRKVSNILLTGRTEWSNVGGLLGMVLELADIKHSAHTAQTQTLNDGIHKAPQKARAQSQADLRKLNIYGATNLNHLIATSRRFIFRTGMPMNVVEYGDQKDEKRVTPAHSLPTWEDERIRVWTMALLPTAVPQSQQSSSSPRKRSHDELIHDADEQTLPQVDKFLETRKAIVSQMFNSKWKLDNLMPQLLSKVQLPAKIFVRDATTRQLLPYEGPLPGGNDPVPEMTVWVREPWPGALTEHLVPPSSSREALSYIIRNYPQRGKFQPERAIKLRVPKGRLWAELTAGHTVQNELGEDVTPEMVLSPGRQGGGFAVIDLPSPEYIESLITRPEWLSTDVMDGVGAIVWILGPGVDSDARLQKFQAKMAHLTQIIASPDRCGNILALEEAATNSLRHHFVDKTVFPLLQYSPLHDQEPNQQMDSPSSDVVPAQRGLTIKLEPQVELETSRIKQPIHLPSLRLKIAEEFESLGISTVLVDSLSQRVESNELEELADHGDCEIIVLGTGSSHPSRCRNVSGTLIRVPDHGSYLLDCGEGTLGTLRRMFSEEELENILRDLKMVWVSHLHADHHLGLASIVKAWSRATSTSLGHEQGVSSSTATKPDRDMGNQRLAIVSDAAMLHWLHEYGPAEDMAIARILPLGTTPGLRLDHDAKGQSTFLSIIKPGESKQEVQDSASTAAILDGLNLRCLNSVYVNHCRGAQAVSLTFKSGLKISYSGDCRPSAPFASIGRDSHVLIHEATFQDDMRSEAIAKKHSTAGEALIVAHEMKAHICLLTHFSQRYPEMPRLGAELRGRRSSSPVKGTTNVLEDQEDIQPVANLTTDEDGVAQEERESSSIATESSLQTSSVDKVRNVSEMSTIRRNSSGHLELIDKDDIQNLISASGMKVVFAFDYMRLKLKDVPILVAKQPLLRRMYDEGIGKDAYRDFNEDDEQTISENVPARKVEKKNTKADQLSQLRALNEKRARSSEDKWAAAARQNPKR